MEIAIIAIGTLILICIIVNQAKKNKNEKITKEREKRQQEVAEQSKRYIDGDFR